MRDLPDFILSDEESKPSLPPHDSDEEEWKACLLVFGFHLFAIFLTVLFAPKAVPFFALFYLPFVQWIYVAPIMIIFSKQGRKKAVKGALLAALLTAAPLALLMLLAFAGLALCAVIMAGAGIASHH